MLVLSGCDSAFDPNISLWFDLTSDSRVADTDETRPSEP